MQGGYYRIDYNEKLTILSLNTLYYSNKNDRSEQSGEFQ